MISSVYLLSFFSVLMLLCVFVLPVLEKKWTKTWATISRSAILTCFAPCNIKYWHLFWNVTAFIVYLSCNLGCSVVYFIPCARLFSLFLLHPFSLTAFGYWIFSQMSVNSARITSPRIRVINNILLSKGKFAQTVSELVCSKCCFGSEVITLVTVLFVSYLQRAKPPGRTTPVSPEPLAPSHQQEEVVETIATNVSSVCVFARLRLCFIKALPRMSCCCCCCWVHGTRATNRCVNMCGVFLFYLFF